MNVKFVFDLIKEIEQRAETKKVGILSGNMAHDEYKAACAAYQAHLHDVALIKELAKKENDDD